MSSRIRRYTIAMAFRMACFIGIFFVHGWLRWALLAAAVFLPYVAVLLANQANQKGTSTTVEQGAPADARALTVGPEDDVVTGEVLDDRPTSTPRHHPPRPGDEGPPDQDYQERVA